MKKPLWKTPLWTPTWLTAAVLLGLGAVWAHNKDLASKQPPPPQPPVP